MSLCPSTSTICWRWTRSSVCACTGSTAPALTPVTAYGAYIDWNNRRRAFAGIRSMPRLAPRNVAWSRSDHSHSRLVRKPYCEGTASLLSVVSICNTLTCSDRTRPILQADECSCDACGSMNDRECTIVWLLWWWRSDLYDARPMAVDFHPPSTATRLTLT